MNPLALLAFITSIGTTAPEPKPRPEPAATIEVKEHGPKPLQPGMHKCRRGGWDGN